MENTNLDSADVYESDDYVDSVSKYIENDFKNFRYLNTDNSIGGMIVCRSNPQAKKINEWFKKNSKLTSGLVMSDSDNPAQADINKQNQINFRENGIPDILVVHYMLTTGYDVKRLKKMYLLRGPKAQSLLQTISRVNRPYKSPTGKVYQYGYIVDFIDIEAEYNNTLDAYIKELEDDVNTEGDDPVSLSGLIVDKENIKAKFDKYCQELKQFIQVDNLEQFTNMMNFYNKEALLKIKKLLIGVKECSIEFKLSRADEYSKLIDDDKVNKYLKTVNDRISFINLTTNTIDTLDIMNNEEVINVIYEFIKTKVTVIDLSKFVIGEEEYKKVTETIIGLQNEIKSNKNKKDIKIQKLEDLIKDIFRRLEMNEFTSIDDLSEELRTAYKEAKAINEENQRLSATYGGSFAFVKTLSEAVIESNIDRSDIEKLLIVIYNAIKDTVFDDALKAQGKLGFVTTTKAKVTVELIKNGLYKKIKNNYDSILEMLYVNLLLYKESI